MEQSVSFDLAGRSYSVSKPGLRKWLELEETNKQIIDYMRDKNMVEASNSICSYLLLVIEADDLHSIFWKEIAEAYISITMLCIPSIDLPLLHGSLEDKTEGWDYDKRTWYLWSHLLASRYGWSLEYIANVDFDDALALLQEIFVENQLKREWEWSLTELAYSYNKVTQRSEFRPLPRPSWMGSGKNIPASKAEKPVRMPVEMMPIGLVMKWEEHGKIVN